MIPRATAPRASADDNSLNDLLAAIAAGLGPAEDWSRAAIVRRIGIGGINMITFEKKSELLEKVRETVYATKDKRLSVDGHGQFIGISSLIDVLNALGLVEWKEDDVRVPQVDEGSGSIWKAFWRK